MGRRPSWLDGRMDCPKGAARHPVWDGADRGAAMTMVTTHASDAFMDATACDVCGLEGCEDHLPPGTTTAAGFPATDLEDAVDVAARGQLIEAAGVPYVLDGIIPAYGMLGFIVAF